MTAHKTIFALALCYAGCAFAQGTADSPKAQVEKLRPADFPSQATELVVPTPPGGGLDVAARLLAKAAENTMEQRIFVNNRVGAGGLVAYTWLATQAPNDGSVMGLISNSILDDSLLRAGGKWSYKNIEPLVFLNYEPVAWIVSTKGPYKDKSLKDIIAVAKADPTKLNIGSMTQSVYEFLAEEIEDVTGAKFAKIPFQGSAPALVALLGGHIDVSFGYLADYRSYLANGDVKAIAIAGATRSPHLPDVPTFNEQLGTTAIVRNVFRYVGAPAGIAPARRAYLTAGLTAALKDPDFVKATTAVGAITNDRLNSSAAISAELDKMSAMEREFLTKTGRLKP